MTIFLISIETRLEPCTVDEIESHLLSKESVLKKGPINCLMTHFTQYCPHGHQGQVMELGF